MYQSIKNGMKRRAEQLAIVSGCPVAIHFYLLSGPPPY